MFKFFENLVDPYQEYSEKNSPPNALWPFFKLYLAPFKFVFFLTGITSILTAAVEILLIWYLGRLVALMTTSQPSTFFVDHGYELAAVVFGILFIRPVIQVLDVLLINNALLPNVGTLVRYRAHKHVLRQSVGWFENDFAGRIANRIMQTPPAMGEVVFQVFDALAFSFAYLCGALIMLYGTDVRLTLPLLLWAGLFGLLVVWTIKRIGPASKASSNARSQVTGRVVDSYTNIHAVKMFDHSDTEIEYGVEAIEHSRKTFQREMRLFTIMDFGLVNLNGALVIGVVGWAVLLWVAGSADLGVVAAACALTLRLNGMSGWIMWATTSFFRELGVVSEGMETISAPIEIVDHPAAKPLNFVNGKIEFKNLSHHYGLGKGGLDNINLTVAAGEKVGLVGKSGAGKSTLIKLILRFYETEEGQILVDDQDIKMVTQKSLRQQIGVVQQENSLMHRSLRDNIRIGNPNAEMPAVEQSVKDALASDFIKNLSDGDGAKGFDARVGERGVKLSGGQRQRIALARVLLKDAPILILDEATAALDSDIEAQIQSSLHNFMKRKTVIAIAHRLSTIAEMDRIVVLDEGKIVEQGTHTNLLESGGVYANLWKRQSGGFLGASDS